MNGLAVSLASRSGLSAGEMGRFASEAEGSGFEAFFVSERCADAFVLAQAGLDATHRITVGTAVANAPARHPAMAAMTAMTLAEESHGRFLMGLGVANPLLNEGQLGLPPRRPLAFMREYVAVVRSVLSGDGGIPGGESFPGSGFVPDRRPDVEVPIFLAGLLPRMLGLAGEVADGVFLNLMTTAGLPEVHEHIEAGLARADRARSDLVVACLVPCCLSADADAAARAARRVVAGYARHPAAGRLFAANGFESDLARVRERLDHGDDAAADAVSDAMIDAYVVHGAQDRLPERVAAYRDAGVDLPVLFPMPVDDGWSAGIARVLRAASTTEITTPKREDAQNV